MTATPAISEGTLLFRKRGHVVVARLVRCHQLARPLRATPAAHVRHAQLGRELVG